MTTRGRSLATVFLGLAIASCAAGPRAPGANVPQAPVGPEPKSVDEAQADIDRWSAQLGIAPTTQAPASTGTAGARPEPSPPAPTGADRPVAPQSSPPTTSVSDGAGATSAPSECVTPCRAIASMRRSVASLCRLAGEDDARCIAARKTLDEGERRVARCGC